MQHVTDDRCSNKHSSHIFPQRVQSLGYEKDNLKILLHINLSTIDVFGFTEYWLFGDEITCYNLPTF